MAHLKFFALAIVIGLAVLVVTWSTPFWPAPPEPETRKDLITIGWIGPLTGDVRFLGVDNLNAVTMAIDDYNREKQSGEPEIRLIFADDEYNSTKTSERFHEMVSSDKPALVFLSSYLGTFLVAAEASKEDIILVNTIDNDQKLGLLHENVFSIGKETEDLARLLAEDIQAQGFQTVHMHYYTGDDFMPTVAKKLGELLSELEVVVSIGYAVDSEDFSLTLGDREYDVHVFLGYAETKRAMADHRKVENKSTFYAVNPLGEVDGIRFTHFTGRDGNPSLAGEFLEKFKKRYGSDPAIAWTAMQAYDAAQIALSAIRAGGGDEDRIREGMLQTRGFPGVSGMIDIMPDGTSGGIYWKMYVLRDGDTVPAS